MNQLCEIIDNQAQVLCERIRPETEPTEIGWFDMNDPEVEKYVNALGRSVFISQLISLDQNLGKIFSHLKKLDLYDDLTIIFSTDNGANIATYGTNGKLRGTKGWGMLGGVQTPTLIKSPELGKNKTFEGLFHVTDWMETFGHFVNFTDQTHKTEDSINQWQALVENKPVRDEVMIHVDPFSYEDLALGPNTGPYGAVQVGNYIVIGGQSDQRTLLPPMWYSSVDNPIEDWIEETLALDEWHHADPRNENQCWWLFDVKDDPFQRSNLLGPKYGDQFISIYNELRLKIEEYGNSSIADPIGERESNGYPLCVPRDSSEYTQCYWSPGWCDNNGY